MQGKWHEMATHLHLHGLQARVHTAAARPLRRVPAFGLGARLPAQEPGERREPASQPRGRLRRARTATHPQLQLCRVRPAAQPLHQPPRLARRGPCVHPRVRSARARRLRHRSARLCRVPLAPRAL